MKGGHCYLACITFFLFAVTFGALAQSQPSQGRAPISRPKDLRVLSSAPLSVSHRDIYSFTLYDWDTDQDRFLPAVSGQFGPSMGQPMAFKTLGQTQNSAVILTQKKEIYLLTWSHQPTRITFLPIQLSPGYGALGAYPKQLSDSLTGGVWVLWSDGTVSEVQKEGEHRVLFEGFQLPMSVNGMKLGKALKGFQQLGKNHYAAFTADGLVTLHNMVDQGRPEWSVRATPIESFATLHLATQQYERLAHLKQAVFDPTGEVAYVYSGLSQFSDLYNQLFQLDLTHQQIESDYVPSRESRFIEMLGLTPELELAWRQDRQWNQKKAAAWMDRSVPNFFEADEIKKIGLALSPPYQSTAIQHLAWDWPTQIKDGKIKSPLAKVHAHSSPGTKRVGKEDFGISLALLRELEQLPPRFSVRDLIRFVSPYTTPESSEAEPRGQGHLQRFLMQCTDVDLWIGFSLERYGKTYEPQAHQTRREFDRSEFLSIVRQIQERRTGRSIHRCLDELLPNWPRGVLMK